MTGRIIQIMQAPKGLYVNTINDAGNPREARVLFVGLTSAGNIMFVYYDGGGEFGISKEAWLRR